MAATRPLVPVLALAALAPFARAQGAPQKPEFPYSMDFGPCLTSTMTSPSGVSPVTHKALIVKLQNGAAAFDTELLRMSSIWSDGWLDLRGTAYDESHGPMPSQKGREIAAVAIGPGVANGSDLADPRPVPFGPLPKTFGAYEGHWLCGDQVVLGYRLGNSRVLEHYAIENGAGGTFGARTFEFAPSNEVRTIVLLDAPGDGEVGTAAWSGKQQPSDSMVGYAALQWTPGVPSPVEAAVGWEDWQNLPMGGPSSEDYLDQKSGTNASIAFVPSFRRPQTAKKLKEGEVDAAADLLLPRLHDGAAANHDEDQERSIRFEPRSGDARVVVDLQKVVDVSRISVYSRHHGDRAPQHYDLYASDAETAPAVDAADPAAAGWTEIAEVQSTRLGRGGKHGTSVSKKGGLGRYRHLLFVVHSSGALFSEVDVFADSFRAPCDQKEREAESAAVALFADPKAQLMLRTDGRRILLDVAPSERKIACKVLYGSGGMKQFEAHAAHAARGAAPLDLSALLQKGDRARWGEPIVTKGQRGSDDEAYAVDTIEIPFQNRFGANMRVCAFDFFRDGRAAITTWNGDVWIVAGLDDTLQNVQWRRFATGLYDPLGLRIVDDVVYVHGRDGITRLHDKNGDGEADFYECFNHDECVTNAFHEFAFDLQTDPEGNFYTSKGAPVNPGGRGFMTIAPHHGTIMKITSDGSSLEVVASGLRAPNGIGVSPDGKVITSGDNEGTFMPRCRLNWIEKPGFYAGVRDTAQRRDIPDEPDRPLCYLPMDVDNSSGGQVWVTSNAWGPFEGRLLHLSYGTSGVYLVCKEDRSDSIQGGVVRFPLSLSSSAMRARFHPTDGQLYLAGFQGWQTTAAKLAGFHRVRYTKKPIAMAVGLRTCEQGIYLTFQEPLDEETASDKDSYGVEIWNYLYSPNYGSPELSILHPERKIEQGKQNRDALAVTAVSLSPDRRTVFLAVTGMQPAMQMKVLYNVDAADGTAVKGELHGSIHVLGGDPGFPSTR